MVSGNMPAFSAYQSTQQTLSAATFTKLNFQTKDFDTNSNFDTTNMRFLPTVAGYYQLTGGFNGNATNVTILAIYKNGTLFKYLQNNGFAGGLWGTLLVQANGSTDYFELWGYTTTGQALQTASTFNYFQGAMVRSA